LSAVTKSSTKANIADAKFVVIAIVILF